MKRILYIINSLAQGGAETHLLQLCEGLNKKDFELHICVLFNDQNSGTNKLLKSLRSSKVIIHLFSLEKSNFINMILSFFKILKIINLNEFKIIHTHLPRSDFLGGLIKLFNPKVLWISTLHDAYIKEVYSGYKIYTILKYLYFKANKIIVVSEYVKKWAIDKLLISKEKVEVIPHGVVINYNRKKLKVSKFLNLGCLARFEKRKGLNNLIDIMPEILNYNDKIKLFIAGNDPFGYKLELDNKIKALGLQKNIYLETFTNNPNKFLSKIDIYVYASVAEGFGLSVLEALNMKVPVVCFDILPLNKMVIHDKNGLLAEPFKLHDFKEKLLFLIKNERLRDKFSNFEEKHLIDNFSMNTMISKVESLYKLDY